MPDASSAVSDLEPDHMVRLEGAKSAEPPINSGSSLPNASSAFCDALRDAMLAGLACRLAIISLVAASQFAGSSPATRRLYSAASAG
ncbi:Uncharacterised protein [Vibrio cholerae]|uniref:Uncharacterized protein n=1 Tax=Vibrio cholerae TaxID=666 RepID=A0A655S488_VIBCL|nr:Uncharacterised protein [Vibrio cholerae]CSB24106.1 Uncharacterised protein [Vibrio cholerae]CSB65195.1 Uncharacterised protein [Vibrio cholerae]CSC14318.1 Uncharacterised protein [Vibrio cholerae]CSD33472.1 Uncharacterised protein [Vibrio cholerae]